MSRNARRYWGEWQNRIGFVSSGYQELIHIGIRGNEIAHSLAFLGTGPKDVLGLEKPKLDKDHLHQQQAGKKDAGADHHRARKPELSPAQDGFLADGGCRWCREWGETALPGLEIA